MLPIKTYQDAVRQAKKLLLVLGIDAFQVHAEEVTYYGDLLAVYSEYDVPETDAKPGDHIKIQSCLCDMGSIESDLRSSEFFDRHLNFLFTIKADLL